jgi:CheY-like chemotaxis protein
MSVRNSHKILLVDDEPHVLAALTRHLGRTFDVTTAEGGPAALSVIEKATEPFAVALTDMRMPFMTGLDFIAAARKRGGSTVFMMLSGNADQQTAVDAINQGRIFRFLCKPCPPEAVADAVRAACAQYDLVTAERVLLRETLTGSVKLMVEALALTDPRLGVVQSLAKQAVPDICRALGVQCDWSMIVAGSVCLIGLVGVARDASGTITEEHLREAAAISSKLVCNIPRMENVSIMLGRQREPGALPENLQTTDKVESLTIGARVLRYVVDLALAQRTLGSRASAVALLLHKEGHDPRLLNALRDADGSSANQSPVDEPQEIKAALVRPGMILVEDVVDTSGRCLLAGGQPISELAASTIRSHAKLGTIPEKLMVRLIG